MAVYRLVQTAFWQDVFVLGLTPEEKYFYLYLLTGTKTTQCGIYPLPKRLAEMELGYSGETVDKLLQRFIEYGKILYDEKTQEVYILNWIHYNPIRHVNVEKCVLRELQEVKTEGFVQQFIHSCVEEGFQIPLLLEMFGAKREETAQKKPAETVQPEKPNHMGGSVVAFYEKHFGELSRETEKDLLDLVTDMSEALVLKAMKIAHEKDIHRIQYVKGILRGWKAKNYKTLLDVEQAEKPKSKRELREWEAPDYGNIPTDEELKRFLEKEGWKP